jgi:uncharacterized protein YbbC (DUF1343 family)
MTAPNTHVLTGVDVLARGNFAPLRGLRVGLVTNPTGRAQDGQATADLLFHAPGVRLTALFGPEHGIRGLFDQAHIDDRVDDATGLPVYSLYGTRTAPTAEQMDTLDSLVFDVQDIGCRFYTYISTLGHVLEAANACGLPVFVLDRPNPITGTRTEGPLPDIDKLSFTAYHPLPVRHGLTVGEIARLMHSERGLTHPLKVIACEGWRRRDWYDATGLLWTNPSPNMRSLAQATLYPGVGLLEMTNVSVGRGTDTPFEVLGAPWIDARALAAHLNAQEMPGVRAVPVEFTPRGSVHAENRCGGVNLMVTDRTVFDAVRLGITLAIALRALSPQAWQAGKFITLLASSAAYDGVLAGQSYEQIAAAWADDLGEFGRRTQTHLLYA